MFTPETGLNLKKNYEFLIRFPGWESLRTPAVDSFYIGIILCEMTSAWKESVKDGDVAARQDRGPVGTRAELLRATSFCKWHH